MAGIPTKTSELRETYYLNSDSLRRARQLLVAAYGGAPQDAELVKLVEAEFWYHPDPKFQEANLPAERRAVLAELDKRIAEAAAKEAKQP